LLNPWYPSVIKILEKQNRYQMAKFFSHPRTSHQMALLFKDSGQLF
jgi:hypothetical protein